VARYVLHEVGVRAVAQGVFEEFKSLLLFLLLLGKHVGEDIFVSLQ
jgi:hypothetical protein